MKKEFRDELYPLLNLAGGGISEFTFPGLYLFRNNYSYRLSWLPGKKLLVRGEKDGEQFCSFPLGLPDDMGLRTELLQAVDYVKNVAELHANELQSWLELNDYALCEDRNNFDYIYLREDLATLKGRKYHKKRNLVNAFVNHYSYEGQPLSEENINDAFHVLRVWREQRDNDGDFDAAKEALELKDFLHLSGYLLYAEGEPVAYAMGEEIAAGTTHLLHVEKAVSGYKGIYQFLNQAYAQSLPLKITYINREQDLGDEGLRQAKMTYRPCGFIKKYRLSAQCAPKALVAAAQREGNE